MVRISAKLELWLECLNVIFSSRLGVGPTGNGTRMLNATRTFNISLRGVGVRSLRYGN